MIRAVIAFVCASLLAAVATPTAGAPLPVTEIPATGPGDTLAVFYSGDGGWAASDRGMVAGLVASGVPVVGVDSLRYFLTARAPAAAAADLATTLRHYMAAWHRDRIVLGGYSFGAGALPLILPKLPADLRARIRYVALVGPEQAAELHFWPGDWLNLPAAGAAPIGPAIAGLRGLPVACIYGSAEANAPCARVEPAIAHAVAIPGGHHYGGDYAAVSRAILAGLPR